MCEIIMPLLRLFAFAGVVQCLPWDDVKPTAYLDYPLRHQEPPKPTPAVAELRGRQAAGDNTCGYEDGTSCKQKYFHYHRAR